jgi:hypothetical protein
MILLYLGTYTPPDCEFNQVVLNFSVVSQGRQFDRLAIMYFGDTEVCKLDQRFLAPKVVLPPLKDHALLDP